MKVGTEVRTASW